MYVPSYTFRIVIPKAPLLSFIASIPPEHYCFFVPANGSFIYGHLLYTESVEYLLNEFAVKDFLIIELQEVNAALQSEYYAVWGNRELLNG